MSVRLRTVVWLSTIPTIIGIFSVFLPQYQDLDLVTSDPNQFWWALFQFIGRQYVTIFFPLLTLSAYFSHRQNKRR